jgi:hypothetical protein
MHFVEIVGLIMRVVSCARCVGVGLDVSKLGFVYGMLLWGARLLYLMGGGGPLKVGVQFPKRRSCLCVYVYVYLIL